MFFFNITFDNTKYYLLARMAFICEIKVFNKQTKEWNDNLKYIKIIVTIRRNRNHVKQKIMFILYMIILAHHMYVSFISCTWSPWL